MSNTVVRTNVMSLNSHRNLGLVATQQRSASQRLSSGYRINSAADDSAGLGISEKMRSQIRSLDQASRNGQDGISLIQTAEGALSTVNEILTRVRELVVQAANDTNVGGTGANSDRIRIQDEIDQMMAEIDAISTRTEFNTRTLLDGSLSAPRFSIDSLLGAGVSNFGLVSWDQATDTWSANVTLSALNLANILFGATAGLNLQEAIEAGISAPGTSDANFVVGSAVSHMWSAISDMVSEAVVAAGLSFAVTIPANLATVLNFLSITSANVNAGDLANARWDQFIDLGDAGSALWFQTGANTSQGISLSIANISTGGLFNTSNHSANRRIINVLDESGYNVQAGVGSNFAGIIAGNAVSSTLEALDAASAFATRERSNLGATQNRLEFTIESVDVSSENLSAAESRIRDADMAKEMMRLTQANVLQQAAISMLAQANQAPQSVLQLLN